MTSGGQKEGSPSVQPKAHVEKGLPTLTNIMQVAKSTENGTVPRLGNFWYLFVKATQFPGYRLTGIPTHRDTDSVKILGLPFGVGLGSGTHRTPNPTPIITKLT